MKEGERFFDTARESARVHNYPEAMSLFPSIFTKANVMAQRTVDSPDGLRYNACIK